MSFTEIEFVHGDITQQSDIETIVNSASESLFPESGVDGAIHATAGPKLLEESRKLAPLKCGQVVITKAYNLPNLYIIHTVGPVFWMTRPSPDNLLTDCYHNSIRLAENHKIKSIAFPAISSGAFRYPIEIAAEVALKAILRDSKNIKYLKKIRFVLFLESDFKIFKSIWEKLNQLSYPSSNFSMHSNRSNNSILEGL